MLVINCSSCRQEYRLDEAKVPRGAVQTKCKACGASFTFKNPGPGAAPPPADPFPIVSPPAPAPRPVAPAPPKPAAPAPAAQVSAVASPLAAATASMPPYSTAPPGASAAPAMPGGEDAALKARMEALKAPIWNLQFHGYQYEKLPQELLRRWIQEGRLRPDDMAAKGDGDMQRAESLPELTPYFRVVAAKFAQRRPTFFPPCQTHPQADAKMVCTECHKTLCPDCAMQDSIGMQEVLLCKHCQGKARKLETARQVLPFYKDFGNVFGFPFKGHGVVNLLFYAAFNFFTGLLPLLFAVPALLLITAVLQAFNLRIFQNAVRGQYEVPGWVGVNVIEDMFRGFKLMLLQVAMLLPAFLIVSTCLWLGAGGVFKTIKKFALLPPPTASHPVPGVALDGLEPAAWAQEDEESDSSSGEGEFKEEIPTFEEPPSEEEQPQWQPEAGAPQWQEEPPPHPGYPQEGMPYPGGMVDQDGNPVMPFPFPAFDPNAPQPPEPTAAEEMQKLITKMGVWMLIMLPLTLLALLGAFLYYPAAFMFVGLYNDLFGSLNFPLVLGLVRRMFKDYALLLVFTVLLGIGFGILAAGARLVLFFVPLAGAIVGSLINTYFLFLYYHMIGRVVESNAAVFDLEH